MTAEVKLFARSRGDLSIFVADDEKFWAVWEAILRRTFGVLLQLIGVTASSCSELFCVGSELICGF